MEEQTVLLQSKELLDRVRAYYPEDVERVQHAIDYAIQAHDGQFRVSGDPYIVHPLEVAIILADLQMDVSTVIAGILHDVVEDTGVTLEELSEQFGSTVAQLVDGVTKLLRVKRKSKVDTDDLDDEQAENLRKMILAMVDDIRVVIIKLADRLHNMRTLSALPREKQIRKARETLEVYAPLANRMGIWQLKWQLEDLSFRYLNEEKYYEIAQLLAERRSDRSGYLERVINSIRDNLAAQGIQARITGRPKHIYSIYRKMMTKARVFDHIYDVRGIRIIVDQVQDCYHVLGIVHTMWRPIPGEFDDYIAMPKDNGYQSLHTAVVALDGRPLEVQIRTEEMHQVAEFGIAAHWRYKEGVKRDKSIEDKIAWLRQVTDWREEVEDAGQFVDSMKSDVFVDRIYVFTPKGEIIDLPQGATPVDFAYQIHSEIGHRCRGAKIDGRLVALDYKLKTGDQVEIITAKQGKPSRDWLNSSLGYVATQRARQKIRQWFRRQEREQNISAGREILERELHRLGFEQQSFTEIAHLFKYDRVEDFMAALGYGDVSRTQIAAKIDAAEQKTDGLKLKDLTFSSDTEVQVDGVGDLLTKFGQCCSPVPGDAIVGYITRGKGITIHRADCPNIVNLDDSERLINVSWSQGEKIYAVQLRIDAFDRPGMLRDIASIVADAGISMSSVNVTSNPDSTTTIKASMGVHSVTELASLINKLQGIRDILDVTRMA